MKELIRVWQRPRMVISIFLCALFYAALVIPFEGNYLPAELKWFRPGIFLPVLFSFILGPGAAWGSAIGNLISDGLGHLSYLSFFSFIGNFLLGYVPYKVWHLFFKQDPSQIMVNLSSARDIKSIYYSSVIGNLFYGLLMALGVFLTNPNDLLQAYGMIMANNLMMLIFLYPAIRIILPRAKQYDLIWETHFGQKQITLKKYAIIGLVAIGIGNVAILGGGLLINQLGGDSIYFTLVNQGFLGILSIASITGLICLLKD